MPKRFTGNRTKARQRNITTEIGPTLSSVENPVGHFPGKIDNGTIKVKNERLTPSGRPVKQNQKVEETFTLDGEKRPTQKGGTNKLI